MNNKEGNVGSPIKTFVNQTIKEIEEGLPEGYVLTSDVNFELSVVNQQKGSGGLDLRVLSLGGNVASQHIQKVRFSASNAEHAEQQLRRFGVILKEGIEYLNQSEQEIKSKKMRKG